MPWTEETTVPTRRSVISVGDSAAGAWLSITTESGAPEKSGYGHISLHVCRALSGVDDTARRRWAVEAIAKARDILNALEKKCDVTAEPRIF